MRRALIIMIILAGCGGDTPLRAVPPDAAVEVGPASPWDELGEARGPDLLLGVAWRPLLDTDGTWTVGPLRYSIVDREGEVRVDFPLPWPAGQVTHLDLDAAGPGQLLATAARADDSPVGPDGYVWRTLRLDALEQSAEEVLRLTDDGDLELPMTGRVLALPGAGSTVRVAADPSSGSGLWFLPETTDGRVGDLHRVDSADSDAAAEVYPRSSWLPPDLVADDGGAPEMAWTLQTSPEAPGLALGLDGALKGAPTRRMLTWTAEEGLGESLDLSHIGDLALRVEPSWRPGPGAGHSLFQRGAATPFCAEPTFVVVGGDATVQVDAGGDLDCGWSGPLLDPVAPTFAWFGFSLDEGPGHRLRISHRGEDVWEVSRFRDGVVDRPFLLLEAVEIVLD